MISHMQSYSNAKQIYIAGVCTKWVHNLLTIFIAYTVSSLGHQESAFQRIGRIGRIVSLLNNFIPPKKKCLRGHDSHQVGCGLG